MAKDCRLSVRMIAEETGLDKNAVHRILADHLHMWKICARKLVCGAKSKPVGNLSGLAGKTQNWANFLDKVITGDESWVFDYNPETKQQSAEWHIKSSPPPKKAHLGRSRVKTMLIVFFNSHGILHKEFLPPGQTVNHAFYKDVLEQLRKRVQRVRRDTADNWMLHHNNAPAHTAKKNVPVLPHPPCCPNLAPCDFYLFPKLKSPLKGHHFRKMENIQKIVTDDLHTLMENDFRYCYEQWKKVGTTV